jgi:hypothetical protein
MSIQTEFCMRALPGIAFISLISLGFALACASSAPVPPQPPAGTHRPFSSESAWQHLAALTAIGPRVAGTEGAERARQYLHDQLSKLDIVVEEHVSQIPLPPDYQETVAATNLIAVIPGASPDLVVLGAPYDSRAVEGAENVGANDGASGAAVLLEIARALAEAPLPYTTWIAFFDAEAPRETTDPRQPMVSLLGSTTFALNLAQLEIVPHIRLMVVMNRVCDRELVVARDVYSHRLYREEFFKAAVRTGNSRVFPQSQAFESTSTSHRSFIPYGLRRIVAVTGSTADEESVEGEGEVEAPTEDGEALDAEGVEEAEAPVLVADFPEDNLEGCSQDSLKAVGEVTLDAVGSIGARLAKVDRFSESPLGEREEPVPVPEGAGKTKDDAPEEAPDETASEDASGDEAAVGETASEEAPGDEAAAAETASLEETPSEPEPAETAAVGTTSEEPSPQAVEPREEPSPQAVEPREEPPPQEAAVMPEASAAEGIVDDPWAEDAPEPEPEPMPENATPVQEPLPDAQSSPDGGADPEEIDMCGDRPCSWEEIPE